MTDKQGSIQDEWAYALATFPAWGMVVLIFALAFFVKTPLYSPPLLELRLAVMYGVKYVPLNVVYLLNLWWVPLVFFVPGNVLFYTLDDKVLAKAGIKIAGGMAVAAVLVPVYLFLRARSVTQIEGKADAKAYLPLGLWILCFIVGLLIQNPIVRTL